MEPLCRCCYASVNEPRVLNLNLYILRGKSTSSFVKNQALSAFNNWVLNLSAVHRLSVCLVMAGLTTILASSNHVKIWTSVMLGWDVFSFFMICLGMIIFFRSSSKLTIELAKKEDESRTVIFMIVLISVLISLFGILILLSKSNRIPVTEGLHEVASMGGVGLSWMLLHMIFALHYAHIYYGENQDLSAPGKCGLIFPGDEAPDYLDFAYFSFVIGMTFQVSDINITGRNIRRLVLLHSIISFLFNTIIVALMISIISGLGGISRIPAAG